MTLEPRNASAEGHELEETEKHMGATTKDSGLASSDAEVHVRGMKRLREALILPPPKNVAVLDDERQTDKNTVPINEEEIDLDL